MVQFAQPASARESKVVCTLEDGIYAKAYSLPNHVIIVPTQADVDALIATGEISSVVHLPQGVTSAVLGRLLEAEPRRITILPHRTADSINWAQEMERQLEVPAARLDIEVRVGQWPDAVEARDFVELAEHVTDRFDLRDLIGEFIPVAEEAEDSSTLEDDEEEEVEAAPAPTKKKRVKVEAEGTAAGEEKELGPVERLNQRFAVVQDGNGVAIIDTSYRELKLLSVDGFYKLLANRKTLVATGEGKTRLKNDAQIWFEHPDRREYREIVFEPGGTITAGAYNLWQGWPYQPDATKGSFSILFDHLLENVCHGNREHFDWVISWAAQMIQEPMQKPGVALVLRGQQGTGKSIFGKVLGKLLGTHQVVASNPRMIVGQFNAHLLSCILLRAEEACWAGDKNAAGVIKDLITGDEQMIERKGKDPIPVRNCVRVLYTSNEGWVVPAGPKDRRFTVLDVSDKRIQDRPYFRALEQELEAGGYEALMDYLLNYKVDEDFLGRTLQTTALTEQKIQSLDLKEAWWLEILQQGHLPGSTNHIVKKHELWADYLTRAEQAGARHRSLLTEIGIFVGRIAPGLKSLEKKEWVADARKSVYYFALPSLQECRDAFDKHLGTQMQWQPSERWGLGSDEGQEEPPF
jgi:hypothetical protein